MAFAEGLGNVWNYSGGLPSKGWIAQMEEYWYGSPEVSGSSLCPVKFSLTIFRIIKKIKSTDEAKNTSLLPISWAKPYHLWLSVSIQAVSPSPSHPCICVPLAAMTHSHWIVTTNDECIGYLTFDPNIALCNTCTVHQ